MNPDERLFAEERLDLLQRADDYNALIRSAGWKRIYAMHEMWVQAATAKLRDVNTADMATAINALQRWQIANDLIEMEANVINDTMEHASKLQSGMNLETALILEKVRNEHESTEHRAAADPAGY